jgi:predicted small lipoprotein YifL
MWISVGKFLTVMMTLSLAACGGFPTTHPDAAKNNPTNHQVDMKDCTQSYPETADGVYLKRRIECMKLKGWQ